MKQLQLIIFLFISYTIAAKENINVYIAANYIANITVNKFESTHNFTVRQNYFNENDEMLAKIAAGANGYDLIFPTAYAVEQLQKMDKLLPLDLAKIPNIKNVLPSFLNQSYDPKNHYSIPYAYDNVMLAYNKKELKKLGIVADSWAVIFEPRYLKKLKGRVTVFNSQRNVFAAALLYLGKDPNSGDLSDLKEAQKLIQQAMPYWAKFDSDTYYRSLVRGDIVLAMSYSVDIFRTLQDLKDAKHEIFIEAALQKEGNMYELDNLVIPKDAKNITGVYQLINHLLSPASAIELANQTGASIMNQAAIGRISPHIKATSWIYPPDMRKMHSFKSYTPKTRIYINEVWLELQFGSTFSS